MNPRTWVLKASTLPLDHRSSFFASHILEIVLGMKWVKVISACSFGIREQLILWGCEGSILHLVLLGTSRNRCLGYDSIQCDDGSTVGDLGWTKWHWDRFPVITARVIRTHVSCTQTFATESIVQYHTLTLNLPTTTIVAQPFNVIKWQLKFNLVA